MSDSNRYAFGWPGIEPRWTSSAKSGVGTAMSLASRVWFTLSHGIINEIYYPRIDQACTRDMGFIITDGHNFFSEEKRHTASSVKYIESAIPAFRLENTCKQGNYRIIKEIISDPARDTVIQHTRFIPQTKVEGDYRVHVLLAPHLANRGAGNYAHLGEYKGVPMLFAARDDCALALACSAPWKARSVGFVGFSDGWQDLTRHKRLTWQFEQAENGNVALVAEIDWQSAGDNGFVLTIGFGSKISEASHRARASLFNGFEAAKQQYLREWRAYHNRLHNHKPQASPALDIAAVSASVMRIHEAKRFPGGIIASLAIPWGSSKGDDDLGGYHLVWPRDLVESAGGLMAAGVQTDAHRVLHYLMTTQEADGHWSQNMWLDGTPYWSGTQIDETAFPILLVDLATREKALKADDIKQFWPALRRAARYIVCNGPVTQEDRWEEDPGFSPFTLAVEIAALLAAADMADLNGESSVAQYLRETADAWNSEIEHWTYVTGTDLAMRIGVEGYYVRIAPPEIADAASPLQGFVPIKNRPLGSNLQEADHIISPDALALVRFGLRAADDPRIVNTVKVIDALLKAETPFGPVWHRYNSDGYGEHENGDPFNGTGIGRGWPLLTGERGHYELAAGRFEEAAKLLKTMEGFAGETGLLPEQVWDAKDLPERELQFGRPSGSAMPLVWAHAEYLKLRKSLEERRIFDMPSHTVKRYQKDKIEAQYKIWRFNHKCRTVPAGLKFRIETLSPVIVHWSADSWQTTHDSESRDTGIDIYVVDIDTQNLTPGDLIDFTFYWPQQNKWEQVNYCVAVVMELK